MSNWEAPLSLSFPEVAPKCDILKEKQSIAAICNPAQVAALLSGYKNQKQAKITNGWFLPQFQNHYPEYAVDVHGLFCF